MDRSQYQTERKQLYEMLAPALEGELYQLIFGWGAREYGEPEEQNGWWLVVTDYPSFCIHFLGSTFGEAEGTIMTEWLDEPEGEGW